MANGNFGGGSGAPGDPYLVEDFADLDAVRNDLEAHYKQTANIDMDGETWDPIGNRNSPHFTGEYDGDGFLIQNLTIDVDPANVHEQALFQSVHGTLKNIHLRNASVKAGWGSGTLVAWTPHVASGILIEHCSATGTLESPEGNGGGLVGNFNGGVIRHCWADVDVDGTGGTRYGGLIGATGWREMLIEKCYALGDVKGGNPMWGSGEVGGFIGYTDWSTTVKECFAKGDVEAFHDVGGFAGSLDGPAENCYATGDVHILDNEESDGRGGGFCGTNGQDLKHCYAFGVVTSDRTAPLLGGLTGGNWGEIIDCYYNRDANGPTNFLGVAIPEASLKEGVPGEPVGGETLSGSVLHFAQPWNRTVTWDKAILWEEGAPPSVGDQHTAHAIQFSYVRDPHQQEYWFAKVKKFIPKPESGPAVIDGGGVNT